MIYTNKIILFFMLLFLSGCNVFTFAPLFPVFKNAILGVEDPEITDEYIASREYSFIKVKIGRSSIAFFVLLKIDEENNFHWINADQEKIITNHGKIIEISGLSQGNFRYSSLDKGAFPDWHDEASLIYLAEFLDPRAFFNFESSITQDSSSTLLEYVNVKSLRWNFTNRYDYKDGLAYYSEQRVHPHLPKLTISYYYK